MHLSIIGFMLTVCCKIVIIISNSSIVMDLICINLGLERNVPSVLVNTNQIYHSYMCYDYNITDHSEVWFYTMNAVM